MKGPIFLNLPGDTYAISPFPWRMGIFHTLEMTLADLYTSQNYNDEIY